LFVRISIKWVSVFGFTGKTFLANPILSSQNTEQSFLFMDVSGTGIKTANTHITQKAEKNSGGRSLKATLNVINVTVKSFLLLAGRQLLSGNVRQIIQKNFRN